MKYYLIPVELCQFCLKNKISKLFQLYIYLKIHCSGKMKITKNDKELIKSTLKIKSNRTIANNLKRLLEYNFIGFNAASGYYFIRGFDQIRIIYRLPRRRAVYFHMSDLKHFKGFLVTAVITNLILIQEGRVKAAEHKKWRSNQPAYSPPFPIANLALAKILDISVSTASRYKRYACDAGYITIKKNFEPIPISYDSIQLSKKYNIEESQKIVIRRNMVFLQEPDLIKSNMKITRRKKIDTY